MITGNELDSSIVKEIEDGRGIYERSTSLLLWNIIRPDAVCLDIGANIGVISITLSYIVKEGKIHAFEPAEENFNFLVQDIEKNNINRLC